jgi:hypothetical protein
MHPLSGLTTTTKKALEGRESKEVQRKKQV